MAPLPIKFTELLQLSSVGVDTSNISFTTCVSPSPPRLSGLSPAQLT